MSIRTRPCAKWVSHKGESDNDLEQIETNGKTKKNGKKAGLSDKFDDRFYVTVYQLARDGKTAAEIAQSLGVDPHTIKNWRKANPAFNDAIDQGMKRNAMTFQEYVYNRLPPELQTTWDKINDWDDHPNAHRRIINLLGTHGIRARQQLFIHALISRNFNASRALESLCMSKQQLLNWTRSDPNFGELLQEIDWHRKNFYEDRLYDLVKDGNPAAVIFVNKTKNKDRGYGTKLEVEHTGSIDHKHQMVVDLESLNLPLELRRQILEHIEQRQTELKGLPAPKNQNVLDVSFEVLNEEEAA